MSSYVVARFVLDNSYKQHIKSLKPKFGSLFGEAVYFRTYSRVNTEGEKEKQETWADTVIRVVEGCMSIHKDHYIKNKLRWVDEQWQTFACEMTDYMFNMRFLPAGRGLWAMGSNQVYQRGAAALYNCSTTRTTNLCEDASWVMDMLMNGCGCGIKVDDWKIRAIKPDKKVVQKYIIEDSREGWVNSLFKVLNSYLPDKYGKIGEYYEFDYSQIREAGIKLSTFGGISSGAQPLIDLLRNVENVLDEYADGKIGNIRAVSDIMNLIGCCVVSGNIRRSSEILMCEADSDEYDDFIHLKDYERNPERINFGYMSNNSVILTKKDHFNDVLPQISKLMRKNGEPGFMNLINMQKYGRMGELMHDDANMVNPCITGDTVIYTDEGIKTVNELIGKQFTAIVNYKKYKSTDQGFWSVGVRDVNKISVRTSNNCILTMKCTSNHRILTPLGWQEIKDLKINDKVCTIYGEGVINNIEYSKPETVYDCTISEIHYFVSNGLYSHNCGEIALEHRETCNLAEVFPSRCFDDDETFNDEKFLKAIKYATFYCKTVSILPTHHRSTNSVISRNRRIGVSISGITEFIERYGMANVISTLRKGYKKILKEDKKFSREAGVPCSIRHSTVKPSGCSRRNMLVSTTRGLERLDEIGVVGGRQWQRIKSQVLTHYGQQEAKRFYVNGYVETRIITTEDGLELESSMNHKYQVVCNDTVIWKEVKDLEIGDKLMCKTNLHPNDIETTLPVRTIVTDKLDERISKFIGLILPFVSQKIMVRTQESRDFIDEFCKEYFGCHLVISDLNTIILPYEVYKWLGDCSINDMTSRLKMFRTSSKSNVSSFIEGIFMERELITCDSKINANDLLVLIRNIGKYGHISSNNVCMKTDVELYTIEEISQEVGIDIEGTYMLDTIKSIRESKCQTFDIEVDHSNHSYILGGVVSHNSISQLVGVPSGMHYPIFKYAIRRMRVSTNSKFCQCLKRSGIPNEVEYYRIKLQEGSKSLAKEQYKLYAIRDESQLEYIEINGEMYVKILHPETTVFEFPVDLGKAREAKDVSAWEQFSLLAMLQREWSDNLVSCTVYYNPETEGDQIDNMLTSFAPVIKSVSVLPHTEVGTYPQMPYEGIDKQEYERRKNELGEIDWSEFTGSEGMEPKFCTTESCEL